MIVGDKHSYIELRNASRCICLLPDSKGDLWISNQLYLIRLPPACLANNITYQCAFSAVTHIVPLGLGRPKQINT